MYNGSLKTKIYGGFAIIVVLLMLTALVSMISLKKESESREAIRYVEAVNTSVLEIDRDLQEMRTLVDRYIRAGSDVQFDAVLASYRGVTQRLATATKLTEDSSMNYAFREIADRIERYAGYLENIASERQLRRTLVGDELPAIAGEIEKDLSELAVIAQTPASALAVARLQSSVFQAQRDIRRYFTDPDTGAVKEAVRNLRRAHEQAADLPSNGQLPTEIRQHLGEFERLSLRAVQATRSYLFFVNVVMAGEASEVRYYASRLRSEAARQRTEITRNAIAATNQTTRLTAIIVMFTVALASLIAVRLSLSIVPPIMRLTGTFEELAVGRTLLDLPDSSRTDEIGRMTRAARFFSSQNQKTRDLLTESEQLRHDLERNAEKLETSIKELDDFAYVASHDLKSPLRGIRQLASWIKEDAGDALQGDAAAHMERLVTRVEKMDTLLEDLLNFSRAGRTESEAEWIDVNEILQSAVELTDNPSNVRIILPNDAPRICVVAPPLEQVLRNLIGNAVKHHDKGANGTVEVSFWAERSWCSFRISDNGPGIDPSNHLRAFKMYQRVGRTTVDGSGMGLAIIKKQIETRGAKISLTSTLGNGATFEFNWPMAANGVENEHRNAS